MKEKKTFLLPQAEIITFINEDIIFTSAHTEECADDDWSHNDGAETW